MSLCVGGGVCVLVPGLATLQESTLTYQTAAEELQGENADRESIPEAVSDARQINIPVVKRYCTIFVPQAFCRRSRSGPSRALPQLKNTSAKSGVNSAASLSLPPAPSRRV